MVCMVGHWRMAAVVKLLLAENCSDITPEEIKDDKIAAQILQKRHFDVDEANLLEEEDMHIFGCRPMTDPLHLVCCNACKKPVKASHYYMHAERCGSLNSITDSSIGIDNDLAPKKPPRKGRKMSQITTITNNNQITRSNMQEETRNDHQITRLNMQGETTNNQQITWSNMQEETESIDHKLSSVESQSSTVTMNHATVTKNSLAFSEDIPTPLATKIYHCQRNSRLRFELGQIYFDSCRERHFANFSSLESVRHNNINNNNMVGTNVLSCSDNMLSGPEKNGFPQIKVSKSSQKGPTLATTVKGMPNGRYPATNQYLGGSG